MINDNNVIQIYRGESFTIDKLICNKDGSPYIISNKFVNPYFLLSISNSVYNQNNREIRNYWIPLSNFPKFNITQCLEASRIQNFDINSTVFPEDLYLDGDVTKTLDVDDAVIHYDERYVYFSEKLNKWIDYECPLSITFLTEDTSTWEAENYLYSIQLVSGIKNEDWLINLAKNHALNSTLTKDEIYIELLNIGYKFPEDYDVNQPLGFIYASYPILNPKELKVINYMQGGVI